MATCRTTSLSPQKVSMCQTGQIAGGMKIGSLVRSLLLSVEVLALSFNVSSTFTRSITC